jgi:hypothetical protein
LSHFGLEGAHFFGSSLGWHFGFGGGQLGFEGGRLLHLSSHFGFGGGHLLHSSLGGAFGSGGGHSLEPHPSCTIWLSLTSSAEIATGIAKAIKTENKTIFFIIDSI